MSYHKTPSCNYRIYILEEIDGSITPGNIFCFEHHPSQQRQVEQPLLIRQMLRVRIVPLKPRQDPIDIYLS